MEKIKILEVNNIDLPGRRFNGYDLLNNQCSADMDIQQAVIFKQSQNEKVIKILNNQEQMYMMDELEKFETNELSIHSNLSVTSPALISNKTYEEADLIHFHMFHNTKLSLISLLQIYNEKKVVISIHDPWWVTGRCVHYGDCDKWKAGCLNCEYLDTMFPFKKDNCNVMWRLKQIIYQNINPDIIVHSKYMLDLINQSPLTSHFNKVHFIPLGIDLEMFNNQLSQEEARTKLKINKNNIVLFFRNQAEFKGVEHIVKALKKIKTDKKITILTCDGKSGLDELKDKYDIIQLGKIKNNLLVYAYNACDIFIMPSRGESFGMMAVEAMACSKPVIIFNNTALPSVTFAPECGVLVEDKNSEQLMEKIKYLIENPQERIRRGQLGRKICQENYDINKYNKKIIDLYREIYYSKKEEKKILIDNNEKNNEKQVQAIKNILNKFTKKTFKEDSLEYKKLIYKCEEVENVNIDYANIKVQEIINEYNNKLYEAIKNKKNNDIFKQIENAIKLLITDRDRLKNSIQYKINQIFSKKD